MRRLLVLLTACRGAAMPPTTNVVANAAPVHLGGVNVVCPESVRYFQWNRELFPGCPPRPFRYGVTCEGKCPTPCRETVLSDGYRGVVKHEYDDRGRWALTIGGGDLGKSRGEAHQPDPPGAGDHYCTREGDHGTCTAIRLDRGETSVIEATLRYDDDGNVLSIQLPGHTRPEVTFEWAASHQLVLEKVSRPGDSLTIYRYDYDSRGRVVHISSSGWGDTQETRYTYGDTTGLVTKIVDDYSTHSRFTYTFEYDAQRRPTRLVLFREPGPPPREDALYEYSCSAPRPFAEAVAILEKFQARACACTDHACRVQVAKELQQWRTEASNAMTFGDPEDQALGARFLQLDGEIEACMR